MADKKAEVKVTLERTYIVPLSAKLRPVRTYKRARKAVKLIRGFMARHMKVEDRDVKKIKLDKMVNNELWFRGISNPPARIKLKAKKMSDGMVLVELAEVPKILQYKLDKEKKKAEKVEKEKKAEEKTEKKEEAKPEAEEKTETEEKKEEMKEKQASVVEAGLQKQALEAKKQKHEVMEKPIKRQTPVQRNIPKSK